MRESRYFFQGTIVLLFLVANLICSGLAGDFVSIILPISTVSAIPDKSLGAQMLSGVIIAIAISPSLGYLIYALSHAIFLVFGGWMGLYKRNGLMEFIDKCPDMVNVKDVDVKASWYFCTNKEADKYVEWIRRRMDAYLISISISLNIFFTNTAFFAVAVFLYMPYKISGLIPLWLTSIFFIAILLYIGSIEKKKGVEGFKLFLHQTANKSFSGQNVNG